MSLQELEDGALLRSAPEGAVFADSVPYPIKIKRLNPNAILPTRGTAGSAGFDLAVPFPVRVTAGQVYAVGLGFALRTPPGFMTMIAPRSSTFKRYGIHLANTIGIVDADYCGDNDEITLLLHNPARLGTVEIPRGTRIAQGIFVPVFTDYRWDEVETLSTPSRGGFGSTGL